MDGDGELRGIVKEHAVLVGVVADQHHGAGDETVNTAPMRVSSRAHFRSAKRSRFSATQLCWKKSCHGAMVVPTIAMTRKTRLLVIPPSWHGGRDVLRATEPSRDAPERECKPGKVEQAEHDDDALPAQIAAGDDHQGQAESCDRAPRCTGLRPSR